MKTGLYAVYNKQEFKTARFEKDSFKLVSQEPLKGFKPSYGAHIKIVTRMELEELYIIKSYAVIKEEEVEIEYQQGELLFLAVSDENVAKKLGFEKMEAFCYRKTFNIVDVDRIIEKKILL